MRGGWGGVLVVVVDTPIKGNWLLDGGLYVCTVRDRDEGGGGVAV